MDRSCNDNKMGLQQNIIFFSMSYNNNDNCNLGGIVCFAILNKFKHNIQMVIKINILAVRNIHLFSVTYCKKVIEPTN